MSEIEIGEYVKTRDGKIGKFVRYSSRKDDSIYKSPFNCFIKFKNRKSNLQCHRDYIVKHSKKLIDLIEVGDFVDGVRVDSIDLKERKIYIDFGDREIVISEDEIYTIVTKEQFKNIEYKVGE